MPLKFLIDENLRSKALRHGVTVQQATSRDPLDVICVGDPGGPARGTSDKEIICWSSIEGRIVVTLDVKTFRAELDNWLVQGFGHPGVVRLGAGLSVTNIVELLETMSYASLPSDWSNRFHWLP